MDLPHLQALAARWGRDRVELGVALRGPDRSVRAVWEEEIAAARRLGLSVTFHMGGSRDAAGQGNVGVLSGAGLLGPDLHVVHMTSASEDDLRLLAEGGAPLVISPWTEMEVGYGVPDPGKMAVAGLKMGLSVDNTVLAGQVNMFEVMRLAADLADGFAEERQALSDATVFDWAARAGAEAIGAPEGTGTLAEGGPADLIAVDMESLGTRPAVGAGFALTHAAEPQDVSFVMIDGVIHKRDGELTRVDLDDLLSRADAMIGALQSAAGTEG